jgi:hypothetical protein
MKRIAYVTLLLLLLTLPLSACSSGESAKESKTPAPESSQTEPVIQTEEQVVHGIINRIDDYLVLLTEDGNYLSMDLGEGVTLDGFEEGDNVDVTYTGNLEAEEILPVVTAITKTD